MKKMLLLVLIICSSSAFAGNRLEELRRESPNATPYEILKRLYDDSKTPAVISDFDHYDSVSNQECAIADLMDGWPKPFHPVRVLLTKQPQGPLFPPTSKEVILFGVDTLETYKNGGLNSYYDNFSVYSGDTDLSQIYSDNGTPFSQVLARKNGELIAFRTTILSVISFGYCYRK